MPPNISPPRTPARFQQPKYAKLLTSPLYTKNIDLGRASEWLTGYLTKDCPTEFMPAIRFDLIGHMEDHDMPDGLLAQSRILDMNVLPVRQVETMMLRFWDRLLREQARNRELKHNKRLEPSKDQEINKEQGKSSGKFKGSSPPKEPTHQDWPWGRSSTTSASRSSRSPTSPAPFESNGARIDSDRSRAPRVRGRDAHVDELTRRASHHSHAGRHSKDPSSGHFLSKYSPGPYHSSKSRNPSHDPGYSPTFFTGISQSN